jgi:hypothetical protein
MLRLGLIFRTRFQNAIAFGFREKAPPISNPNTMPAQCRFGRPDRFTSHHDRPEPEVKPMLGWRLVARGECEPLAWIPAVFGMFVLFSFRPVDCRGPFHCAAS